MPARNSSDCHHHLSIFTSILTGGGIQAATRDLAVALVAQGHRVDLVVCHGDKATQESLAGLGVNCFVLKKSPPLIGRLRALRADPGGWKAMLLPALLPLKASKKLQYIGALKKYLHRQRPEAIVGAGTQASLVTVWAASLARTHPGVTVTEHSMLSTRIEQHAHQWRWRHAPALIHRTFNRAHAVAAVSHSVAADLSQCCRMALEDILILYNPAVNERMRTGAGQPATHPWLTNKQSPVILGVGRLAREKDYATLLRALARLRRELDARLIIIGDGPLRQALQKQARSLTIDDHVAWVGWDDNPFAYMAAADLLVLSSRWEAFGNVLVEAMACGCPVIATQGSGGPAEILENGRHGPLVPIGDDKAMAHAMAATLANPPDSQALIRRSEDFSAEAAAERYADVMRATLSHGQSL